MKTQYVLDNVVVVVVIVLFVVVDVKTRRLPEAICIYYFVLSTIPLYHGRECTLSFQ